MVKLSTPQLNTRGSPLQPPKSVSSTHKKRSTHPSVQRKKCQFNTNASVWQKIAGVLHWRFFLLNLRLFCVEMTVVKWRFLCVEITLFLCLTKDFGGRKGVARLSWTDVLNWRVCWTKVGCVELRSAPIYNRSVTKLTTITIFFSGIMSSLVSKWNFQSFLVSSPFDHLF